MKVDHVIGVPSGRVSLGGIAFERKNKTKEGLL